MSILNKHVLNLKLNKQIALLFIRNRKEPKRKPQWKPMAPSKLFKYPIPPVIPDDELKQIEVIEAIYKHEYLSIQNYFKTEFYLPVANTGGLTARQVQVEEEEQLKLLEENEKENQKVAELRALRLEDEFNQKKTEFIIESIKRAELEKQAAEDIEANVRKEIEREKTYITKEKLEDAIEEALSNPVSYDFSVDLNGNVHYPNKLHPYAFKPSAIPDSSSNSSEVDETNDETENSVKLKRNILY